MKTLSKSLTKETLKIFLKFTKTEWVLVSVAMGSVFITGLFQAYVPFLYKDIVDIMTLGSSADYPKIVWLVFYVGLVGVVIVLLRRIQDWASLIFQPRVKQRILEYCYDYLQRHSIGFFNNNFAGSLVRKVNRYDRAYEDLSDQLIFNLGQTMIRITILVVAAAFRSWVFSVIIIVWVFLFTLVSYIFARRRLKYDLEVSEQDSTVTAYLADTITNAFNVKVFASLKDEEEGFSKEVTEQQRRLRKAWQVGLQADLVQGFLLVTVEVAMIYAVFRLWQQGVVTVGDFALVQVYLGNILGRLWDFGRNVKSIYKSLAEANEMTEILSTEHEIVDSPSAKPLEVKKAEIDFHQVSFAYHEGTDVFKDFDFKIHAGERIALVGPSGGGKSTIVKMLLRFFDVDKGRIFIDGQSISEVTQDSLRKNIALVPQDPILFHRSLLDNIRYARPEASEEEVIVAAKQAHCHEFIESFPLGYKTFVGERGVKLSGGERQRVAIARAILKDAPILVLDEATSSLDSESEALIQDAMKNLMKNKTVIVIAHRLSTIMQMDRIVVLDGGRIIEQGKHDELLKAKQGVYQKLWEIQAGGFAG